MNEQEFIVQKIRTQYTEQEHTTLDQLKELDAEVKRPANLFGYLFGSVGALVMGAGMSLVMTEELAGLLQITNPMVIGVAVGTVGLAMAVLNYPIYKGILSARRKKYAARIVALSDSILNG